jgi:preprotein translocase subunit SecA
VPGVKDAERIKHRDELDRAAQEAGRAAFQAKLDSFKDLVERYGAPPNFGEQALSQIMLGVIDEKWKDHLYDLDQLRAAIQYRAWGQKDPLIEYKQEAFEMFKGLMADLETAFTERWLKLQIQIGPPPGRGAAGDVGGPAIRGPRTVGGAARRQPALTTSKADASGGLVSPEAALAPKGSAGKPAPTVGGAAPAVSNPYAGVGRNDPCPCGSGKKFKKCHGAAA